MLESKVQKIVDQPRSAEDRRCTECRRLLFALLASVALCELSCSPASSGAPPNSPVKEGDLEGIRYCAKVVPCEPRTRLPPDQPWFKWVLSKDHFEFDERSNRYIPHDVVLSLLGEDLKVRTITGKWHLNDDVLMLSDIRGDGKGGYKNVQLRPTAGDKIRITFGTVDFELGK